MHHLDHCAKANRALAGVVEQVRGEQQQRRAYALAASLAQIFGDLGDGADAGGSVTPELLLNGYEVFSQQFENLFRRRYRQGAQGRSRLASLVCAVIGERQLYAEIPPPQCCDDGLQVVAIFAGYPYGIALNARLHLLF